MTPFAAAFRHLVDVLDSLDIPFAVAGSVASSSYGFSRTTMDVDVLMAMDGPKIPAFAAKLGADFYCDPEHIASQFAIRRAANVIHIPTAWKIDLFLLDDAPWPRSQMLRRSTRGVKPDGETLVECPVLSVEDTVLGKLAWYRAGGEVSERQWNDLRGIRRVVGSALDLNYLRQWANTLGLADLLERLLDE